MQLKPIGIALIVIGIMMIAFTGFNLITTEKVVDIGPIQIDKEKKHPVQWSPIVGVIMLAGGIGIMFFDRRVRD
jgi:hypothetical protein